MDTIDSFFEAVEKRVMAIQAYPHEYIEEILNHSHPLERNILCYWVLLPGLQTGTVTEQTEKIAAAFFLINLNYRVHAEVGEDDVMADKINVLIGDLLLASSYGFLAENCEPGDLEDCAKIAIAMSESWFAWNQLPAFSRDDEELTLPLMEKEFGLIFRKAAELGCRLAAWPPERQTVYRDLVSRAAQLWWARKHHRALDRAPRYRDIAAAAATLGLSEEISWFLSHFEDTVAPI